MPRFTASSYLMYFFFGWYPIIHGWLKLGRVWTVKATNGWILIAMQRYMVNTCIIFKKKEFSLWKVICITSHYKIKWLKPIFKIQILLAIFDLSD